MYARRPPRSSRAHARWSSSLQLGLLSFWLALTHKPCLMDASASATARSQTGVFCNPCCWLAGQHISPRRCLARAEGTAAAEERRADVQGRRLPSDRRRLRCGGHWTCVDYCTARRPASCAFACSINAWEVTRCGSPMQVRRQWLRGHSQGHSRTGACRWWLRRTRRISGARCVLMPPDHGIVVAVCCSAVALQRGKHPSPPNVEPVGATSSTLRTPQNRRAGRCMTATSCLLMGWGP